MLPGNKDIMREYVVCNDSSMRLSRYFIHSLKEGKTETKEEANTRNADAHLYRRQ